MFCRRSLVLLMMLVYLSIPAGSSVEAMDAMDVVSIRIYDYAQTDEHQLQRAEHRVSAIYDTINVRIDWRAAVKPWQIERGHGQWPHDPPADVSLVVLAPAMVERLGPQNDVAGYAPVSRERGGRVAYVFGERTRAIAAEAMIDVSEVLAGVIAHELAHLLMPERSHSRTGVMRPQWAPAEFRSLDRERFSAPEAESIRRTIQSFGGNPSRVAD